MTATSTVNKPTMSVADLINLIIQRVHPWSAVKFRGVDNDGVHFETGFERYVASHNTLAYSGQAFCVWHVSEKPDGNLEVYRNGLAIRMERRMQGWVRNDEGILHPPDDE